jgi:hypothetical protein
MMMKDLYHNDIKFLYSNPILIYKKLNKFAPYLQVLLAS